MASPSICIDCSPLLVRSAGVKTYMFHWLNAMRELSPERIRTFLAPDRLDRLLHEGGIRLHPWQIATLLFLNRMPPFVCGMVAPSCDIFHASNLLRKVPNRSRLTTTLHDLTAWIVPDCHTPAMVAADKAFAERVLRRADGVIAVSENTKRDAIRILGLHPDRIRVIHLGVPPAYFSVHRESIADLAHALSLHKPYFLLVGTIEPRKNIDTLLAAWQSLPVSFRRDHELIIAGMPGWRAGITTEKLLQANCESQGIRYLGYVPEPNLPALTAGAMAFVYPSLYEGFGIPAVQAMAAGCPVITSNVSSLPEIMGDAAILVDPRSVGELSAAIQRIGESLDLRRTLIGRGLERATQFTWTAAAAKSLEFFASIV